MKTLLVCALFLISTNSRIAKAEEGHPGACTQEELHQGYKNLGHWRGHPMFDRYYEIYFCKAPTNGDIITEIRCETFGPHMTNQFCCRYMYGVKEECWVETNE